MASHFALVADEFPFHTLQRRLLRNLFSISTHHSSSPKMILIWQFSLLCAFAMFAQGRAKCSGMCNRCHCRQYLPCGHSLTIGTKGRSFDLQNGDSRNRNCLRCFWIATARAGTRVRIRFDKEHFGLGDGDRLNVYDGGSTSSPIIVKWTKGQRPVELTTSSDKALIEFKTDNCSGNVSRLRVTLTKNDCGGLIRLRESQAKTVFSPLYPRNYPKHSDCLWLVQSYRMLISAVVKFKSFWTERVRSNSDTGDYLLLFKSLDSNTDQGTKYSGKRSSTSFPVHDSPGILIKFVSDGSINHKGFQLQFRGKRRVSICDKPKKISNGRIRLFDFSRKATYSCCLGYTLVGPKVVRCGTDGWEPRIDTRCVEISNCSNVIPVLENGYVSSNVISSGIGSEIHYKCNDYFQFRGSSSNTVRLRCNCDGTWTYHPVKPVCERRACGEPPGPPVGGLRNPRVISDPVQHHTTVTYECPSGYGLDGIPYRRCTVRGTWEPITNQHQCSENLLTCDDPGYPAHAIRTVFSFAHGRLASFRCPAGFQRKGSMLRTCDASNKTNTYWTGTQTECIDMFKTTLSLAAQLRESFVDRTIACENQILPNPFTDDSDIPLYAGQCRGRSFVYGPGCVDLMFALDCSGSVGLEDYEVFLNFTIKLVNLFDISAGQARVSVVAFDHRVHPVLRLRESKSNEEVENAIKNASFCGGATATRKVLEYIEKKVLPFTKRSCKKSVFLLTDGKNNWAGDPVAQAARLKAVDRLEIYTISFGTKIRTQGILRQLASTPDYFISVRKAPMLDDAVTKLWIANTSYDQCGITSSPSCRRKSVGGCDAEAGSWPWTVPIYTKQNNRFRYICVGTIIGDCWILTAAHCYQDIYKTMKIPMFVVTGDTERQVVENSEETHLVKTIYRHPEYNQTSLDNDIALLELDCNVKYSAMSRKICLPQAGDEQYYNPPREAFVAGWGVFENTTGKKEPSRKMQYVALQLRKKSECRGFTKYVVTDSMICTGDGLGGSGACWGDSGGPLFVKTEDNRYVIIGIVSWGIGCGQEDEYDFYTDVSMFSSWIQTTLKSASCEQTCSKTDEEIY